MDVAEAYKRTHKKWLRLTKIKRLGLSVSPVSSPCGFCEFCNSVVPGMLTACEEACPTWPLIGSCSTFRPVQDYGLAWHRAMIKTRGRNPKTMKNTEELQRLARVVVDWLEKHEEEICRLVHPQGYSSPQS